VDYEALKNELIMTIDGTIQDFALASVRLHLSQQVTTRALQSAVEELIELLQEMPSVSHQAIGRLEAVRQKTSDQIAEAEERTDELIAALEKLVNG